MTGPQSVDPHISAYLHRIARAERRRGARALRKDVDRVRRDLGLPAVEHQPIDALDQIIMATEHLTSSVTAMMERHRDFRLGS